MAQERKARSAAGQTSASERPRPPRLPDPEERTGDPVADALLDTRDHVAAAAAAVDRAGQAPDAAAKAVQDAVSRQTASLAKDLRETTHAASQAATEAREAIEAANHAPSRGRAWSAALMVAVAVLAASAAGWFARDHVAPNLGLAPPTCAEAPRTADSGIVFCVVSRP